MALLHLSNLRLSLNLGLRCESCSHDELNSIILDILVHLLEHSRTFELIFNNRIVLTDTSHSDGVGELI